MFDFAWTEIALIGVVALIAIGPKDLPVAIKAVAEMVKKARRMAGEFQTHVDEMVREANLHEVRDQFNDLRRMDIKGKILDAVDGDKTLRKTIADNPFEFKVPDNKPEITSSEINPEPPPVPVADGAAEPPGMILPELTTSVPGLTETEGAHSVAAPEPAVVDDAPPAFIPPSFAAAGHPSARPLPPAFVPPAFVRPARALAAHPYG